MNEQTQQNTPYPLDIFVGTKHNKLMMVPTLPKWRTVSLNAQSSSPITSIFMKQSGPKQQQIIATFTDETQVYELIQHKIPQNQIQLDENPYNYQCNKLFELPASGSKLISCYQDKNYFATTNAGEIYYGKCWENESPCPVLFNKLYDNLQIFGPGRGPTTQKSYSKSLFMATEKYFHCAFIGKGVLPFLYDFNEGTISWKAKNVRNDQLDLQVSIHDVDCCSYKHGDNLAVANANNKIRIYDVRGQRKKPLSDIQLKIEDKTLLTRLKISPCQNYMYVGNHSGNIYQLDVRKNLGVCSKFKGITTTIQDIYVDSQFLVTCSLDSYLRVFDIRNKNLQLKRYLNAFPICLDAHRSHYGQIALKNKETKQQKEQVHKRRKKKRNNFEQQEIIQEDKEVLEHANTRKVKQLRGRNKVGLWYLKPENIPEFPDIDSNQLGPAKEYVKKQEQISGDYQQQQRQKSSQSFSP